MRFVVTAVCCFTALGCISFPPPRTLGAAPTASTYANKCPLGFTGLTPEHLLADDQPYAEWKAPDADAKREMGEAPGEFNRMSRDCESLQGGTTAKLRLDVKKARMYPNKPSTFTYELVDGSGSVVHAFEYTNANDWNAFMQARFQAAYLCQYLARACDGKVD